MRTNQILKWVIVLFLLAALPVMTAALAQGQEPAAKELPAVTEPGESLAPDTYNVYETESNDTQSAADLMNIGDVMGGKIGAAGDVDNFKFIPEEDGFVLIDIDAVSIGSSLDSVVCLIRSPNHMLGCSDDTDTLDSLLFFEVTAGIRYFIRLVDFDGEGGDQYPYELILSNPLLISANAANLGTGNVAGIPFRSEDILAYSALNTGSEKWVLFFDGSDVGVKTLPNFADASFGRLLLSVSKNQQLPGVGTVTPWDIVIFDPERIGPTTIGTFQMGMRGSDHQLSTTAEKLDGIGGYFNGEFPIDFEGNVMWCAGFPVSTAGTARVTTGNNVKLTQRDEDVFCAQGVAPDVMGSWVPYSSEFGHPFLADEDVVALSAYDIGTGYFVDHAFYEVIAGAADLKTEWDCCDENGGIFFYEQRVTQKDILRVYYFDTYGPTGRVVWRGPSHGWNYNIDAIELNGW
jgi:hypothetical protein